MMGGMWSIFGPPPTPEDIAEYERQQDQTRMQYDVTIHQLLRFFDELNEDDSNSMKVLIGALQGSSDIQSTLGFYAGVLRHKMARDFNICMAHGVDHAKEMEGDLAGGSVATMERKDASHLEDEIGWERMTDAGGVGEPPDAYPPPDAPDHDPSGDLCICNHFRRQHTALHQRCMACASCLQFVLASTI